jgi:CRISPR/Cas system CMR-associated protein Cmr3 (group 5 of RAMP superfamily)
MEKIKREITAKEKESYVIDYYAFNSKGTLTLLCKDGTLFNIHGLELEKLREFVSKL